MKLRKYSLEQLKEAVQTSTSLSQVLCKLNLVMAGGNYKSIRKVIKEFNLNTSHFIKPTSNRGKYFKPKRPIEDYLSNRFPAQSNKLRMRLLEEGIWEHKCHTCQNTTWNNKKIPLEMHHIDGNSKNNNLSNLQLLCPNCHAQTNNYRGKKLRKRKPLKHKFQKIKTLHHCLDCDTPVSKKNNRCKRCAGKLQKNKTIWPDTHALIQMVQETSYVATGKQLGVSDNAVRKRIKNHLDE